MQTQTSTLKAVKAILGEILPNELKVLATYFHVDVDVMREYLKNKKKR